jgi:DnaJ-class molecular chaperone
MPEVLSIQGDGWTLPLEEVCPDCQGEGTRVIADSPQRRWCQTCDGNGVLLTDNGEAILCLVEKYLPSQEIRVLGTR